MFHYASFGCLGAVLQSGGRNNPMHFDHKLIRTKRRTADGYILITNCCRLMHVAEKRNFAVPLQPRHFLIK